MSHRRLWAALAALALAPAAPAQSPQATFATVEKADRATESLQMKYTVTEYVMVMEQALVVVDGQQRLIPVTKKVTVPRMVTVTLSLKGTKALTGDGKEVGAKELWERLKPGTPVVLGDESLSRPPFNNLFRAETLLLLSSPPSGSAPVVGPGGAPMPLPPSVKDR